MTSIFIRSENIWNSEREKFLPACMELKGKRISEIHWGKDFKTKSRVFDYGKNFIGPSAIDVHVHSRDFEESHKEVFESLEAGAIAGGVSTLVCMANTRPRLDSVSQVREFMRRVEKRRADIRCFAAVTENLEGQRATDWDALLKLPIAGLSDDGKPLLDDKMMEAVLRKTKKAHKLLAVHEEDTRISCGSVLHLSPESMRFGIAGSPPEAESSMVERDLRLAEKLKAHVHFCHISSAQSLALFRKYKKKAPFSAEITPHHALMAVNEFEHLEPQRRSLFKVCPVIRGLEDQKALRQALRDEILDVFATDHAPHSRLEKDLPIEDAAHGIVALEYFYPLYLEVRRLSKMSWRQFFYALAERPAELLGEGARKGRLSPGKEASFVIFDPEAVQSVDFKISKSDNSPLQGRSIQGKVLEHWINGVKVYA